MLQPGIQQVAFGYPIAQLASGVQELLAAAALAEGLLERVAGFCISHQPLQIRPAHARAPVMRSRSRGIAPGTRFRRARCCTPPDCFLPFIGMKVRSFWVNQTSSELMGAAGPRLDRRGTRAGLFTGRGEEAARVFQQGHWALAGRALRNPSAACPYGSH